MAINELLKNTPEIALKEVLDYLKSIENKSVPETDLSEDLRKILTEDKGLLELLAK